jgi:hypothetical protein
MFNVKSINKLFVGFIFIFIVLYSSLVFSTLICYTTMNTSLCGNMSKYVKTFIEFADLLKKNNNIYIYNK